MESSKVDKARAPARTKPLLLIGPLALFLAAVAYGVLEVHVSADTWIGLASGRQILDSGRIPTTDSFSYTVNGQRWYNQNWLAHAVQYWLYSRVSPDAVVYGTWAQSASVFLLVLFAAYKRGGAWFGALLAAAVVAFGCRDYLYARPATLGFVCIAAMWAIICTLEANPGKRRWLPIALLAPLLLIWGNAHGSFVLGYGVLGLYAAHSLVMRWVRPRDAISGKQIAGILAVLAAAFLLTCLLGPFGFENFTHGERIASSSLFRKVSEWYPPFAHRRHFPPVWRFWTILVVAPIVVVACLALRRLAPRRESSERRRTHARVTVFDAAMVLLGLGMTLWARRFVPIFLIFSAPIAAALAARLLDGVSAASIARLRTSVAAAGFVFAVALGWTTWNTARADLVEPYKSPPEFDLLQRVVCYGQSPYEAITFIERNELPLRLLAEWSQAGMVMFNAPSAKVFMDGRAQQVYDERRCREYAGLLLARDTPYPLLMKLLDDPGTDAVLLRRWDRVRNLREALERSEDWVVAFMAKRSTLYLRKGSPGLERLGELMRAGAAYWPDTPLAQASRGFVWGAMTPPSWDRALASWNMAIYRNPALGAICFRPMTRAMLDLGLKDDARRFVNKWRRSAGSPNLKIPDKMRTKLIKTLDECGREIDAAAGEQ